MAEAFIGMTVSVKLKAPSARPMINGKVVNIHDQMLILENVYLPDTGETAPSWHIPSFQIADLEVIDSTIYRPQFPSGASTLPIRVAPTYADPAILSYNRPPTELSAVTAAIHPSVSAEELPGDVLPAEADSGIPVASPTKSDSGSVARLRKQSKKQTKQTKPQPAAHPTKKGKGWRQTPLLEEAIRPDGDHEAATQSQALKGKKAAKGKRARRIRDEQQAADNGWATEDATDVQDMGDFDFEANLSRFDKKAVFDEIRNDDMTADEDRLVSHNRLPRPGTYGGKNLHHTEMVLSPPSRSLGDAFQSPPSLGELDPDVNSGRDSRRSVRSRNPPRYAPESIVSAGPEERRSFSRALRNIPSQQRPMNASIMSSTSFNRSVSSVRNVPAHFDHAVPYLRRSDSGEPCPVMLPERLAEVEVNYGSRPGLSEESLNELMGRSIAQNVCEIIAKLPGPTRRNSRQPSIPGQDHQHHDQRPVVVVLTGNHIRGARAIAAARHLYGRNLKLLVVCADSDAADSWQVAYKTQIELLQSMGRNSHTRLEAWPSISAQIKKMNSPPALIVDALLDGVLYEDIEGTHFGAETKEIIDWCNRSRAPVISICCPSGIAGDSGQATIREGEPVAVKPDRVLALGGVVKGVLEAMVEGEHWQVYVLDIGLGLVSNPDETVRFGSDWSVIVELSQGD